MLRSLSRFASSLAPRALVMLAATAALAASSSAATVWARCNATHGYYTAYLFRTGDRLPTATINHFWVYGFRDVNFSGISQGRYFIRIVREQDNQAQQTPDGYLFSYYSTPLHLNDITFNSIDG